MLHYCAGLPDGAQRPSTHLIAHLAIKRIQHNVAVSLDKWPSFSAAQ